MNQIDGTKAARQVKGPVCASLERLIASGEIGPDPLQAALARRLDALEKDLSTTSLSSKKSALGWLFARSKPAEPVKGLYIHGGVGRGKTMLMDMFFRSAPISRKRRVHFHAFMGEVHERIGAHREAVKAGEAKGDDPIPPVGQAIAENARLLCFDEFTVTDVADAMILSRLFTVLFEAGVILVATSNVEPDDLYKDGLNRSRFLPFIELLKRHADVFHLDAAMDYRLAEIGGDDLYLTPLGEEADHRIDEIWQTLLAGEPEKPVSLSVKSRTLPVRRAGNGAARFSFDDLLKRPLGAQDYLALAHRFHTLVIEDVPVMGQAERNEAKRLITLVDALYDAGRRVVISAAAPAEDLYRGRSGAEAFEFDRTVSRLIEMRSDDYRTKAEKRES